MVGPPFYGLVDALGIIRESGIWMVAYDAQGTRGHVRLECGNEYLTYVGW